MSVRLVAAGAVFACSVPFCLAQSNPIPMTTSNGLQNSVLTQSGNYVGLMNGSPSVEFDVTGQILAGGLFSGDRVYVGGEYVSFNHNPANGTHYAPNDFGFTFGHFEGGMDPLGSRLSLKVTPPPTMTTFPAGLAPYPRNGFVLNGYGHVGINGVDSPLAPLHVFGPTVPFSTNNAPSGSGTLLIQSDGPANWGGAALSFADGPWENARILNTVENGAGDSSDARGRLVLQTRYKNPNTSLWDWQNNLVLTSNGAVGVNLSSPQATPASALEVYGSVTLSKGSGGSIIFQDGTTQSTANKAVGLSALTAGSDTGGLQVSRVNLDPSKGYQLPSIANTGSLILGWNYSAGDGEQDLVSNRQLGTVGGFRFYDVDNSNNVTALMTMKGNGQVGIGTVTPGVVAPDSNTAQNTKLEVNGNIMFTQTGNPTQTNGPGYLVFADGTMQNTAYLGNKCSGGDYAESVDISGDRAQYEPGDLIVLDPGNAEHFIKSAEPYSTLVAGIYSTKPGIVGRRQTTDPKTATSEIPMAMVGIVPTKVTAENGPIKIGDLLVTSSRVGYAMKGTDTSRMLGAVVGKALQKLDSGNGVIEVLVSLQ